MGTIVLTIKNIESITTITAEYQVINFFMVPIFITVFGVSATTISPLIVTIYDKTGSTASPRWDVRRMATTRAGNGLTAPPVAPAPAGSR